ncbi:MAG: PLP-dependent aminotransferase family protein, partial [Chloroflexota bacterium]|nr:PLP-dependent aminotransferase family protein [Chloroflexota bacterium]
GTFSKTVAPGFRVGWICAASELVAKVVLAKQAGDLHSSTLNQMIVHETVSTGFGEHIATLRGVYGGRQAAMLAALEESMPEGVTWTRPDGGMFIWVELPEGMDATALLVTALDEEGIAFVPGASFFADRSGGNFLRLNYTLATEREIADGIGRLGRLVYREMTRMLS